VISYEYSTAINESPTPPLRYEDLERLLKELYKEKSYIRPIHWPQQVIDWKKMVEFKISFFADSPDLYLTSPSEFKRAKEVGAIWFENEDGTRVTL
jgi:hypothetical protein